MEPLNEPFYVLHVTVLEGTVAGTRKRNLKGGVPRPNPQKIVSKPLAAEASTRGPPRAGSLSQRKLQGWKLRVEP